ncbi:MAG: M20/M25/M40 family metallo-hydrolase [Clostridia bacterium]|nr:M20/M25/M40 family metallo-hydrolase [Clostridia bacterium]
MEVVNKIFELSKLFGVSGNEFSVAKAACEMLKPYVDEAGVDKFGNCFGVKRCNKPNAPKILLDAHLDEIGFVVTEVTDEGFIRFLPSGVDPRMLPGARMLINTATGFVKGIVSTVTPHLTDVASMKSSIPFEKLFIDVGFAAEKVKETIKVGDYICYDMQPFELKGGQICGKSFDDRACFVTLMQALELMNKEDMNVDIYISGSTKEEIGGDGAFCRATADKPDFSIVVDVSHAKTSDAPDLETIGCGPMILYGSRSLTKYANKACEIARAKKIPYVVEVSPSFSGTNADEVQITNLGVPCLVLSLPLKYMHTPVEVISTSDIQNVAKLICEYCKAFDMSMLGGAL